MWPEYQSASPLNARFEHYKRILKARKEKKLWLRKVDKESESILKAFEYIDTRNILPYAAFDTEFP